MFRIWLNTALGLVFSQIGATTHWLVLSSGVLSLLHLLLFFDSISGAYSFHWPSVVGMDHGGLRFVVGGQVQFVLLLPSSLSSYSFVGAG